MKTLFLSLLFLLLLACPSALNSQSLNEGSRVVDARINFLGQFINNAYIVISYELPYSGVVEIELYNQEGEKIWKNQYINSFGENKIVLKASKFNPGETYEYKLFYKKDELARNIVIPPSNVE